MNAHEEAFVKTFIVKDKQDRYRQLLGSPKRRRDFLKVLYHHLDYVASLASKYNHGVESVEALLRQKGAGKTCHVIACHAAIDGQEMLLREALEVVVPDDSGAILCCVPNRLAYYRDELDGHILEKPELSR